ncbi:hypothetical protein ACP70R_043167 [Stipagrostis hirtigluma subsp. patula]
MYTRLEGRTSRSVCILQLLRIEHRVKDTDNQHLYTPIVFVVIEYLRGAVYPAVFTLKHIHTVMSPGVPSSGSKPPPGEPPRASFLLLAASMFAVSFAILLATAFAFCCRWRRGRAGSGTEHAGDHGPPFPVDALPAVAYDPRSDERCGGGGGTECAVCLGAVQEGEMVRRLPACMHLYHAECIDRWLAAHRTCPLCRAGLDHPCMMGPDPLVPVQDDPPDQPHV